MAAWSELERRPEAEPAVQPTTGIPLARGEVSEMVQALTNLAVGAVWRQREQQQPALLGR